MLFVLQVIVRLLFDRKTDTLVASTFPPVAPIVGIVVGAVRPGLKIVHWIMDLKPDQMIALGKMRERAFP